MECKVLLEEFSPTCNIQAFVEENQQVVYFYLWENPGSKSSSIRSCWVRNYSKAPISLDVEAMKEGTAPMLPADNCSHPDGANKLNSSYLKIVWFEEGDGAALIYESEILCVIPGWAGNKDYPGYARDCCKPSEVAMPLGSPTENVLFERIRLADEFWRSWNETTWKKIQSTFLNSLRLSVGEYSNYYAIDGGKWPPKAMVRIEVGEITYLFTLGVSIVPQPKVELYTDSPKQFRRFELAFAARTKMLKMNEKGIMQYISAQTSLPWAHQSWLGHGHTIPCEHIKSDKYEFPFVMLLREPVGAPKIDLPLFRGDKINLLWVVPITAAEQKYAERFGSNQLLEKALNCENAVWTYTGKPKFGV